MYDPLQRMLALEVKVRGKTKVVIGLAGQDNGLLSAGASWSRKRRAGRARFAFQATGMDDRADHLVWLDVARRRVGDYVDITVVEVVTAQPPARHHRRKVDWRARFRELRKRDGERIRHLEARLKAADSGAPWFPPVRAVGPPAIALELSVDGRVVARPGVGDPGWLAATVCAQWKKDKRQVTVDFHGGEDAGPHSLRSFDWPGNRIRLKAGDTVRMAFVRPVALTPHTVRPRADFDEPVSAREIRRHIRRLRSGLREDWHRREAAMMVDYERERPPPRRYPRGTVVR